MPISTRREKVLGDNRYIADRTGFNTWPFVTLVILIALNMLYASTQFIRYSKYTVGLWMMHMGIVSLILSSFYYFGTKKEGLTPVIRRRVVVKVAGKGSAEVR